VHYSDNQSQSPTNARCNVTNTIQDSLRMAPKHVVVFKTYVRFVILPCEFSGECD